MIQINNIYLGDCIQLLKEIEDKSIDAIVSDPPYRYLDHKLDREFDEDIFVKECNRVVKDTGFVVLFGRGTPFYRLNTKLADTGFIFKEDIIWNKKYNSTIFNAIVRIHENIVIFGKKQSRIRKRRIPYFELRQFQNFDAIINDVKKLKSGLNNSNYLNNMLNYIEGKKIEFNRNQPLKHKLVNKSKTILLDIPTSALISVVEGMLEQSIIEFHNDHRNLKHPTQKPVRLMERLIQLVSDETNLILDPFMGSGTTCIACKNINRNYIGFEINEEYFNLAKNYLDQYQDNLFYQEDNNYDTNK